MANHPQQLELPAPRTYSRTEFTALRARVKGVSIATIARLYFDPDTSPYADAPYELERFLRTMRDDLVSLALREGSSVLVGYLKQSIEKTGEPRLTPVSLQLIEESAGRWAVAKPEVSHSVGRWFRPLIAERLAHAHMATLGELITFCNRRGGSWWRAVPRIGAHRARVIVAWLRRHADTLGATIAVDVELADPLAARGDGSDVIMIEPAGRHLAPLERVALPHALSGERGTNRSLAFPYVRARHDLEAIRAYLNGYTGQLATQRAYTRELERLLLWSITQRGVALSSLTVEDCEAYKAFLAVPAEAFTGPPAPRQSGRWRPFAPGGLSPDSQRYAVRAIRAAFDWLVDVRYLAGNPWRAVKDPKTVKRVKKMKIERALPIDLWTRVRTFLADRSESAGPDGARWRSARALLLLMGDAGLRVAEAAASARTALQWHPAEYDTGHDTPATWQLEVVGKGDKERFVTMSEEGIDALRAHWADRGLDFDTATEDLPLVAPLVIPPTPHARKKFGLEEGAGEVAQTAGGYSVRGARGLTTWVIRQLLEHLPDLSESERRQLARTSPHAFRHTFGTQSVAADVPLDVVQQLLGHASLQTTSTYVTAEQRRMRREVAKYHARLGRSGEGH
ncbi:integrase [Trinickia violacea]|uniref:Integrase n=1 Tax=Trinickia violacea TaxID=2571746 RepID=A0A4P8J3H8_9BURK|nr:site-specific integrase [Trinickia violacea]QCP55075.1 integrase [Trinickia violacea]